MICTDGSWAIFELDEIMPGRHGPKKTESDLKGELVKPGRYIILKEGGYYYLLVLLHIMDSPFLRWKSYIGRSDARKVPTAGVDGFEVLEHAKRGEFSILRMDTANVRETVTENV